jgi:hypothetical protein
MLFPATIAARVGAAARPRAAAATEKKMRARKLNGGDVTAASPSPAAGIPSAETNVKTWHFAFKR